MVDLGVAVGWFADADADAGKCGVLDGVDDGFESVVSAVSASASDAETAWGKVNVVGYDNEAGDFSLVAVQQGSGCGAGSVHVGFGIGDDGWLIFDGQLGDAGGAFVLETGVVAFAENVGGPPSDVVSGFGVFGPGVADSQDDPRIGELLSLRCARFWICEEACESFEGAGFAGHFLNCGCITLTRDPL